MQEHYIHGEPVDAIVLGGKDSERQDFNGQYKFEIEFNGEDILSRTLTEIDRTQGIEQVFFVGPLELISDEIMERKKEYVAVADTGDLWGNINEAVETQQRYSDNARALIVCSDLPFLTAESMDWLIVNSPLNNCLKIPVVAKEELERLLPTYQTYYWPMREYPFKWSNNMVVEVETLPGLKLADFTDTYRESGKSNYSLCALKRFRMIVEHAGIEGVYTLLINYLSKFFQWRFACDVPFRNLRSKKDYEKLLTKITGAEIELLRTPFVDVVLDIDNEQRLGIFQRGYDDIKCVVEKQAQIKAVQ